MKNIILVNLFFWIAAIVFPIIARALPTGSGSPPKILEMLVPIFQMMLAIGSTYMVSLALKPKLDSSGK